MEAQTQPYCFLEDIQTLAYRSGFDPILHKTKEKNVLQFDCKSGLVIITDNIEKTKDRFCLEYFDKNRDPFLKSITHYMPDVIRFVQFFGRLGKQ